MTDAKQIRAAISEAVNWGEWVDAFGVRYRVSGEWLQCFGTSQQGWLSSSTFGTPPFTHVERKPKLCTLSDCPRTGWLRHSMDHESIRWVRGVLRGPGNFQIGITDIILTPQPWMHSENGDDPWEPVAGWEDDE